MSPINPYRYTKLLVVACLLATTGNIFAQHYQIVPNDTIVSNTHFDNITHFNITQTNLSGDKLVFSWQQIQLTIPTGWTANLCDNGHCYTDFPLNGTMDTIYQGDYGLMSVGINPGQVAGTAVIRYTLWEKSSPGIKDTLTWIITASNSTGLNQVELNEPFCIYPNPAKDIISIHALNNADIMLTDFSGKQVFTGKLKVGENTIPVNHIPEGNYLISICSKEGEYLTKKMTIKY